MRGATTARTITSRLAPIGSSISTTRCSRRTTSRRIAMRARSATIRSPPSTEARLLRSRTLCTGPIPAILSFLPDRRPSAASPRTGPSPFSKSWTPTATVSRSHRMPRRRRPAAARPLPTNTRFRLASSRALTDTATVSAATGLAPMAQLAMSPRSTLSRASGRWITSANC